jgi:hypothetical protein
MSARRLAGGGGVEGADTIDLAVNLETADRLGITAPRKVLLRPDAFRR